MLKEDSGGGQEGHCKAVCDLQKSGTPMKRRGKRLSYMGMAEATGSDTHKRLGMVS